MLNYLSRRLFNRLLSPIVIALCQSLAFDHDIWVMLDEDVIIHRSKRFGIVFCHTNGRTGVFDYLGNHACELSWFESLFLGHCVKSWVTKQNSPKLNWIVVDELASEWK